MFRMLRSALRTADRFVQQAPSSGGRLKSLGNVLVHLKGPGQSASAHTSSAHNSVPLSSFRNASNHQAPPSFSLPTRVALNRSPLSPPRLPRAPMVPRSMTQVGLGTARNFSSSRHVFHNLVENVPIATRALWEAEWDMKLRQKQQRKLIKKQKEVEQAAKIADKVKPVNKQVSISICTTGAEQEMARCLSPVTASFSEYFVSTATLTEGHVPGVTTFLTIPLYPPNDRAPLPENSSERLLNMSEVQAAHDTFTTHRARVTSLFRRLDRADVWSKGVRCSQEVYGPMITSLQVSFEGWTKDMVLGVVGEAGRHWCDIVEEREREPQPLSLDFIVPTLDIPSTSFSSIHDPVAHGGGQNNHSDWSSMSSRPLSRASDAWSSIGTDDLHIPETINVTDCATGMTLGFSYDFLARSTQPNDLFGPV